ncbi:MAG: tRNA uridine(34) 5-carboxymethylaminomethyl modification radical SAM/GNAT enzyme Elp3, partial [Thermoplasmata archaeon]
MQSVYTELITKILKGEAETKKELHKEKVRLCKKYKLKKIPPDSKILENIPHSLSQEEKEKILRLLRKKPVRSLSGVAVVAVMTSPAKCPHGKCIPCPGGIETNTPQS